MPNTNCLAGIKCPKCGQEDRFYIAATITADVTDGGADIADKRGDIEWSDDSHIECVDCEATGSVGEFSGLVAAKRSPALEASDSDGRLADVLQDNRLDAAHDALSDLLEDEDAGNDDIREAAITICGELNDHRGKRQRALARLRSHAPVDRRYFDAENPSGQKIGMAAEYECGTIRIQLDTAPSSGLIDLVPQTSGTK